MRGKPLHVWRFVFLWVCGGLALARMLLGAARKMNAGLKTRVQVNETGAQQPNSANEASFGAQTLCNRAEN